MKRIFEPAQGSLLVSEPFLADSFFKRSVVLLSEHDKKGTLGFILNKPTDVTVNQAVDNFPDFEAPLYFGGPVETDTLFYIHTLGETLKASAGLEYNYANTFYLRAGYTYESRVSSNGQYFTIGTSFQYLQNKFNISYLVPSGGGLSRNPLSNTIRFGSIFYF